LFGFSVDAAELSGMVFRQGIIDVDGGVLAGGEKAAEPGIE
jgi:hypothetical protein